ncbi:MAG: sensory box protein [Gemmatimonadetes bacterium]|nr:sensory box protein [Gemmatimonadota bacterium]
MRPPHGGPQEHPEGGHEALLRVFASCPVGMAILRSSDRVIVDVNDAFTELFGWTRREAVGQSTASLGIIDSMTAQSLRAHLERAGRLRDNEVQLATSHGELRSVLLASEIVELWGEPHIISTFVDITARKQAEAAASRLAAIVESSDDAIIGKTLDGIVTSWNAGAQRIFGYVEDEMVGQSIRRLIPPERQHEADEILDRIRRGEGVRHFETVRRRKDGSLLDVSVTSSPIRDATGTIIGASKVARDITQQKQATKRFRLMVDSRLQGVMFWSRDGGVTDANDAFLDMLGYTREDLVAGRVDWNNITPPEYAEVTARRGAEMLERGVSTPYEKEYLRKDGTRIPVLVGSATLNGDREGVAFVVDLTERKKLEQQFLRVQRMESIGTLAGGIAHDLNNVLAPILMATGVLQEEITDPEHLSFLQTMHDSAVRGAALVQQVLSFARGVTGKQASLDPAVVMRDLLKVMRETFPKSIEVRFSAAEGLWKAKGDATQLHQVFMNLCVNARDAMPDGGTLTVTMENKVLDETYASMNIDARPAAHVCITIADSGTGIPPELRERIFEPFFTTKEVGKGTGLGLSTSLAILKSHGGFVHVYSEPGHGTTFRVYLPAITGDAGQVPGEAAATPVFRGNGALVLVVDDEEAIRTITRATLERFGYRTMLASNGAEAIAKYAQHRAEIAVVLTDMAMPVMDGPATIVALKSIDPRVKIIASSGFASNASILGAVDAGVTDFIPKPYTAETMLAMLDRVLRAES